MKLSVIIVNYNVEHFLEQCLHAVKASLNGISSEVIVVDNNSVDGSLKMLKEKFPEVKTIANKKNYGFSYANNQAIKESKGEYVLLLNPDTIVEEDTFSKSLAFMNAHPNAGGLGIKMIDGKGNFLPESKRGLPTPMVAFYKIFGLSKLFPRSKRFGRYHLGFLEKDKNHEVDVLAGAFMLIRKSVLDKIGLLDEAFFMYGEDIDLSYRITKAGYKNYYFSDSSIIHYKGESTKKSSINYVFVFYNAMVIFANKHFSKKSASTFSFLIKLAIYFRASLSIFNRFIKRATIPFIDAVLVYFGFVQITHLYEAKVKLAVENYYPQEYFYYAVPTYVLIWLITSYFSGGYDKPIKLSRILRGIALGTGIILVIYALLPETYRYSRALILIGAAWTAFIITLFRVILHLLRIPGYLLEGKKHKRIVIVATKEEGERVSNLIGQTGQKLDLIGLVSPNEESNSNYLGKLDQIGEVIEVYKVDEVIFCAKDISSKDIIRQMTKYVDSKVEFKIAPPESLSIIGSNSINTSGDLYTIELNAIGKPYNRRNKRMFDLFLSLLIILLFPIMVIITGSFKKLLKNILGVLGGKLSWVGPKNKLEPLGSQQQIKEGVISPATKAISNNASEETIERLVFLYAKDYSLLSDISLIIRNFKKLGS